MEDTLKTVRDRLSNASHPLLKDFQENVVIKREDEMSDSKLDVFSVASSGPAISAKYSLQIKHAKDPSLQSRFKADYEAGLFIESTCSGHTNKPLTLDNDFLVFAVEAGYFPMWTQMSNSHVDKVGIQQLAMVLSRLHSATSSATGTSLPAGQSECVEQQKQSLFDQPYTPSGDAGNQCDAVKELLGRLHGSQALKSAVDKLASIYTEKKESLVHGDLSLCNVTVREGKPKLVNLSHTRPGPCSLDLGLLLASYMAQYSVHMVTPEDNDAHRRVAYKMMDACTTTVETYLEERQPRLSDSEVQTLLSEVAGFTACELIRRSVGPDPYPGIQSNPAACTEIFDAGMRLITKYESIDTMGRLLMIGLALC